jgi:hypothetical protein
MGQLLDTAEEWLREDDWNFDRDDKRSLIKCGVKAENSSFTLLFVAREELEILSLLIVSPNNVPEDKRPTAAEFLTRANYGLRIGNFEMDMEDGEVRYKVSVDVEGSQLTPIMVKNMIGTGVKTMDRYFAGLMAICYTGQSAKDTIEQIEE